MSLALYHANMLRMGVLTVPTMLMYMVDIVVIGAPSLEMKRTALISSANMGDDANENSMHSTVLIDQHPNMVAVNLPARGRPILEEQFQLTGWRAATMQTHL